jgi:hypothetical protein
VDQIEPPHNLNQVASTAELLHLWQTLKQTTQLQKKLDAARQRLVLLKEEYERLKRLLPDDLLAIPIEQAQQEMEQRFNEQVQQLQSARDWSSVTNKLHENVQMLRLAIADLTYLSHCSLEWWTSVDKMKKIEFQILSQAPKDLTLLWQRYQQLGAQIKHFHKQINEWLTIERQIASPLLTNNVRWLAALKQFYGSRIHPQSSDYDMEILCKTLESEVSDQVRQILHDE